jgi:hypothetical protein
MPVLRYSAPWLIAHLLCAAVDIIIPAPSSGSVYAVVPRKQQTLAEAARTSIAAERRMTTMPAS